MSEYLEKLVTRYFTDIFGKDVFAIDYVDGKSGELVYKEPLELFCGIKILIDENDLRGRRQRRITKPIPTLIIRQPQELLKQDVRTWIEEQLGKPINTSQISMSIKRKIKHYRKNGPRPKWKMKTDNRKRYKELQAQEIAFLKCKQKNNH